MSTQKIAGASELDKSAHRVHGFATDKRSEGWRNTHVICPRCGHELETSYCEERLYMVRCRKCETVMLTTGESPGGAAKKLGEDDGDCLWWPSRSRGLRIWGVRYHGTETETQRFRVGARTLRKSICHGRGK